MQSGPSIRPPDGIISSYACRFAATRYDVTIRRRGRRGVDGESWRASAPPQEKHRHRGTAGVPRDRPGRGPPLRRLTTTRVDIKKKTATGAADGRARRSLD
ncbi:hypothetical protein EVAR_92190_1 [Eumeta japonica]|uniref:Uncharacterized protein n=1 Tax=Eumeta variegata TaxID=151549 RepID=A0A4C2ABE9_EUMVA|nr:hypothetical protein EVAR_92190_1 [Eumeta japonica]